MPGPHATVRDVREAFAAGLTTRQVYAHLTRTTSWAHPVELLEQAVAHHDPEYIDETPLIELVLHAVPPLVSNALTRAVVSGGYA